jgi:hypothetical protein
MKKILYFLLVCFAINACINKKTEASDPSLIPHNTDNLKSPALVDTVLKVKVFQAFELLKKYADATKLTPRPLSDKLFKNWDKIIFGKAEMQSGGVYIQPEESSSTTSNQNLFIFFEDIPLSKSDHAGETLYLDGLATPVVSLVSDYVRNSSTTLVASVILHELIHLHLFDINRLQKESERNENEYNAYMAQLYFIVCVYNGPDKEIECSSGGMNVNMQIAKEDYNEFVYFFNKANNLKKTF